MRWRQERAGHELSKAIAGMGHSRGWQPGPKVSTMTKRPPQQGQIFRSSCSWLIPPSLRVISPALTIALREPPRRRPNRRYTASRSAPVIRLCCGKLESSTSCNFVSDPSAAGPSVIRFPSPARLMGSRRHSRSARAESSTAHMICLPPASSWAITSLS